MYTNTGIDSKILRFIKLKNNTEIQTPKRGLKTTITCAFYVFIFINENKSIFTVDFDSRVQDPIPLVLDSLNYFFVLSHRTYNAPKTVQTEFIPSFQITDQAWRPKWEWHIPNNRNEIILK